MRAIHIKLRRDLWLARWQCLAIALVLAAGVATAVLSVSTLQSIERTRAAFYTETHFGDVFMHLKRAPLNVVPRLRLIPGVQAVEPRVVTSITLDLPDLPEPATGRVISIPVQGEPSVNRLYLRSGRMLERRRAGEILVSEAFAVANGFRPGDSIKGIIHGKEQSLRIVGIVLSPEYVYSVRPGELLPDDRRFGVLWMGYDELAPACDLHDAFNDVVLTLDSRTRESEVLAQLDRLLAPFGGADSYGRGLQPSHRFLENELVQLRTMALLPPMIFLAVTAFLLQVVLSRMVTVQREQIAMMRAFGYTRLEIATHFFLLAATIAVAGAILGTVLGVKLGADLTALYVRFFRFPMMHYILDWRLVLATWTVALGAVLGGTWHAVWRAAVLPPAQAMQPEAPPRYRVSLLEHLGFQRMLSPTFRMILRYLERRPIRSALSVVGIALSIGILVMGNFVQDTVDHVMHFQFYVVQRQDLMVTFVEPISGRAIPELKRLPGVITTEPFRAVPVRLVHQHHQRRLELLGLTQEAQLYRVMDASGRVVELPPEGIVVSRRLAETLRCGRGDLLRVEVLEGRRPICELPISRVVDDYLDLNAYIELSALRRILREPETVSGVFLTADTRQTSQLYHELKRLPRVAGVNVKRADISSYETTMAENLLRMKFINVIFASIVAIGVVYNCARISLAERGREMATMRVLGFTRREVSWVLLGELAVLVLAAIPLGLLIGYGLAWLLSGALNTEVHRFPLVIHPRTYAFAVLVVVVAAVLSGWRVRRGMDRSKLVEVLKARD